VSDGGKQVDRVYAYNRKEELMKEHRFGGLALLLLAGLVLAACGVQQTPTAQEADLRTQRVPVEGGGSYTDVSAGGLHTMMEDKDFPLINVHIPYEGEIEGTDWFIPFDEIDENLDKLPSDKGAKLVLYCRSGSMSATAARTLVKLGFSDVWNLDGGMIAWEEAGYSLLRQAQ
jgi:rhodanese-related sulfurtransferase